MSEKKLISSQYKLLAVFIVALFFSFVPTSKIEAAIYPITGQNDNTTVQLSQDISLEFQRQDIADQIFFAEILPLGSDYQISVFPLDTPVKYKLLVSPSLATINSAVFGQSTVYYPLISRLLLHTVSPGKVEPVNNPAIQPNSPADAVTTKINNIFFQDNNITVGALNTRPKVRLEENLRDYSQNDLQQVSSAFDISGGNAKDTLHIVLNYKVYPAGAKNIYYLEPQTLAWIQASSYHDISNQKVFAYVPGNSLMIAVFNDPSSQDGLASWYDQSRYKTFKYQNGLFAAHRDYAKGTRLKVTRLKTGVSIIVVVNDWGPETKTGRIIDLDKAAFEALATKGAGEIYVNVEKL